MAAGKVVLRNRVTTEYKTVEAHGPEFYALTRELHADGRPRWEQTGQHDAAAFANRLEAGALRETDIGDAGQPSNIDTTGDQSTQPQMDRGWPTPGEIEQGAGRAADFDEDELREAQVRAGVIDTGAGYPAGAPPTVVSEEGDTVTREDRLAAGVADDPLSGTPEIPATQGENVVGNGSSSSGTNYSRQSLQDLKDEANRRDLDVQRGDGQEGDPLKADYVSALEEDDSNR